MMLGSSLLSAVPGLRHACTTLVREGMVVQTTSPRLQAYRKTIIEMLFTEGNHICAVCVTNGHCELQNLAVKLGVDHITLPYLNPVRKVDASHERYGCDNNRCILCTRCVRVCEEFEGAQTWGVKGRGIESEVITDLDQPWGDSQTCTSCGKCVQVCPTGALMFRSEHELREEGDWRQDDQTVTQTVCPYCGVGCNLELHVQDNTIVKVTSPDDHDVTRGNLCIKGRFGFQHVQAGKRD